MIRCFRIIGRLVGIARLLRKRCHIADGDHGGPGEAGVQRLIAEILLVGIRGGSVAILSDEQTRPATFDVARQRLLHSDSVVEIQSRHAILERAVRLRLITQLQRRFRCGSPVRFCPIISFCSLQRRVHIVQRSIDLIVGGKLHHALDDLAKSQRDANIILCCAGIGMHASLINNNFHRRRIARVSIRHLILQENILPQRNTIQHRYARNRLRTELIASGRRRSHDRLGAVAHRALHNIGSIVEREGCAVKRRSGVCIHLLHKQTIFNIRRKKGDGEIACKVVGFEQRNIRRLRSGKRVAVQIEKRDGIIDGLRLRAGPLGIHPIVAGDVAREVFKNGVEIVHSVAVLFSFLKTIDALHLRICDNGFRCFAQAFLAGILAEEPAIHRIAVDDLTIFIALWSARGICALKNRRKNNAIFRIMRAAVHILHRQSGRNARFCHRVSACVPLILRKQESAESGAFFQPKLDIASRTISRRHLCFSQQIMPLAERAEREQTAV